MIDVSYRNAGSPGVKFPYGILILKLIASSGLPIDLTLVARRADAALIRNGK